MTEIDLSNIPTLELAKILATRADLDTIVREDGMLDGNIWPLRPKLGAVACVDGVALRFNVRSGGHFEGGVIRRKTGKFPNKLAYIGGVVGKNEAAEAALKRHWRTDLGLEIELPMGWQHPVVLNQYSPQVEGKNRPDFMHDPGKHSFAPLYMVFITSDSNKISLGSTEYGGQEASGFEWYTPQNCPPESEWSYDQRDGFLAVLEHFRTGPTSRFEGSIPRFE